MGNDGDQPNSIISKTGIVNLGVLEKSGKKKRIQTIFDENDAYFFRTADRGLSKIIV